jgi:hypothetical protein
MIEDEAVVLEHSTPLFAFEGVLSNANYSGNSTYLIFFVNNRRV